MKDNASRSLFFCVLIITAVFVTNELAGISLNMMLIVGIISCLTLSLPYFQAKSFVFFILPFTSSISGVSVLCMYLILLFKKRRKCISQFIPPILIAGLELFNLAFNDIVIYYTSVISYISFIALFFYLLFDENEESSTQSCIKYFCMGASLVFVLVYVSLIIHHGFSEILTGQLRNTIAMGYEEISEANGKLTLNANTIAYYSIVIVAILTLGSKRLSFNKVLYICCLAVSIIAGVFSFSRTWLMLAAIIFIIYLIISKQKVYIILTTTLVCVLLLFTQQSILTSIYEIFLGRINSDTFADAGGRVPIFHEYNQFWLSKLNYFLFGTGASHYNQVVPIEFSMHCGSQQIWILHGISGVLIFLFSAFYYKRRYVRSHSSMLYWIPFLTCLIFDQSVQFLVPYSLMFPFIPAAYALQLIDNH